MILAITGTPATGKTTIAAKLGDITGWKVVGLNDLAKMKSLYSGYDRKRKCKVVDIGALRNEVSGLSSENVNLIIESHYAQEIPSDLAIVLRTNPKDIRRRAKDKGWGYEKTEENVMAEIMEECKIDTMMLRRKIVEIDTTEKSSRDVAKGIARILHDSGMFLLHDIDIPEGMRERLRKPYGELFKDIKKAAVFMKGTDIIAVGDYVSHSLYTIGVIPKIFVVDGKVRRRPFRKKIPLDYHTMRARNDPGRISTKLWMAAQKALGMKDPAKIEVMGEEDMAVLPFVLMARKGSSVIYGLHDRGACVIRVDEGKRKAARNLLRKIVSSQA
ncbi:MAG: DUF359 domain-containing protein [Candidatus Aenigmarchaeota archaeon]|nr:DUF359 domain-containing protein [Candidatus Aenigmarchaeota archaeon]